MKQIVLLLAFLLSVSCHRRPLEDPANNTTLRVAVNIKAIMNITRDIYNGKNTGTDHRTRDDAGVVL